MTNKSDDDEPVGYGKPPKRHQFKKGQSGCPDGGHKQKQAKKAKAKKAETSPSQTVLEWFTHTRRVKINGKAKQMTRLELALMQLEEDAFAKRDPVARKLLFDIAQRNGWFKAPPPKQKGGGVLVVYPIRTEADWERATEGVQLPLDPLHGIPGAEGLLDQPGKPRRLRAPDEDFE